jgi:hypothetical protein
VIKKIHAFCIILFIVIIHIIFHVTALLKTLAFQESASSKGHFALYNGLVLGHTKYNGVQWIYCNPFPSKPFHCSHRLDMVMIRLQGIYNGAFVVSPDTMWYARVLLRNLLLFSASAMTVMDPSPSNVHSYQRWKHTTNLRMVNIITTISITCYNY